MKVFVAGCGRSGTTYLKTLIDACEDVFIPAESLCLYDYLQQSDRISEKKLLPLFYDEPQLKSWFKGEPDLSLSIPEAVDYIHSTEMKRVNAKYWGQKTPRFVRHIDLFNAHYDDIRWILVYRDPRSVVASMLKSGRHTYSVSQAVRRWKNDNAPIIEKIKDETTDKGKYTFLKYEDLIANFETELSRIYSFLDISMPDTERIFNYQYGDKKSRDYKGFNFERNEIRGGLKPNPGHLDSWKKKLSTQEIAYIESECAKEMDFYGYTRDEHKSAGLNPISDFINKAKILLILSEYVQKWPEYLWKSQRRKVLFKWWSITTSKQK